MRFEADKLTGYGRDFPGETAVSLDVGREQEIGLVSVYASVPNLNLGAFVRFNLFAELMGTRQLVASAIAPANTNGEIITVAGHVADSWHVCVQSTNQRQEVKIGIVGLPCCAAPKIKVRPDLLALVESDLPALEPLVVAPVAQGFVPWGDEFGALHVRTVAGTGAIATPRGRLVHWEARGVAPGGTIVFAQSLVPPGVSQSIVVGTGDPKREGFPAAKMPIEAITFTNLDYGLFEWVS